MEYDLLHLPLHMEKKAHKLRRTVPAPNSYYVKVKCSGCPFEATLFSHSQSSSKCPKCNLVMTKPSGGKLRVINNCSFHVIKKDSGRSKKIEKSN